jgi:hypothetical protein
LQILAAGTAFAFLAWVARLIRQHRLSLRDSLLWLVSTSGALALTVFPSLLRWVATALGVEVPSNAVFALAFVYVLLNLLSATIAISGNASRVRRLTQECTLLRAELDDLRARVDSVSGTRG